MNYGLSVEVNVNLISRIETSYFFTGFNMAHLILPKEFKAVVEAQLGDGTPHVLNDTLHGNRLAGCAPPCSI